MWTRIVYRALPVIVLGMLLVGQVAEASPLRQDDLPLLVYGQTVTGELTSEQPGLFYAFDAQAGDVITIMMIVTAGELDPFVVLSDAERNPLATDDNSGGGLNARLTFIIPVAGRYIIEAIPAGGVIGEGSGTFSLNLTAAIAGEVPPVDVPASPSDAPTEQGDSVRLVQAQPGAPIRDTLSRQAALRLYWFEAQAGEQLAVIPEQMAEFQPLLVLYDGGFAELQRANPGIGLRSTLEQDGVYFLAVSLPDPGSAGGAYSLTFNLVGTPTVEGSFIDIAYGASQRGSIDATVSAVTYRFRGSAGDTVTIRMSRAGGDLNSYLYLLDESGQLLFEDNDSGGDNGDARLVYTLPSSGRYLIVATRLGQAQGTTSGSFLLELESDAPPPVEAEPSTPVLPPDYAGLPEVAYGETVEGELTDAKFMDLYVFLGNQGDTIRVDMQSQNKDAANPLDPFLILLDDERIPLIEHDDIVDGQERDARLEFTLPSTGYYLIVATRFDQETGTSAGPYTLSLGTGAEPVADGGNEPAAEPVMIDRLLPVRLEAGTPAQGTFDRMAVLYELRASPGRTFDLSVTTDSGLDSVLILADQNLSEVVSSGTGALNGISVSQAGRYLVILAPRFGPVDELGGGYILALVGAAEETALQAAEGSSVLSFGQTVDGVIDDENVSRVYTFSGTAGQRVRITMEAVPGSTLDCYLELQDANGTVLDANDDIQPGIIRDSRLEVELPADGNYQVIAARYVGPDADITSGAYQLTLELADQPVVGAGISTQTLPLAYGETAVGEITNEQFLLFYVFDGTAGDVVTISLDHLSGDLDSVLYLYQASANGWVELANNDDSPLGGTFAALLSRVTLPQTGKYLIAVARYGLANETTTGGFAITLTREP